MDLTKSKFMPYLSREKNDCDVRAPLIFPLSKSKITIGRNNEADINIVDANVSRFHAEICKTGDVFTVTDKSSNGSFLNGKRLQRDVATTLKHNDVISFYREHGSPLKYLFKTETSTVSKSEPKIKQQRLENSSNKPTNVIVISDDDDSDFSETSSKHKRAKTSGIDAAALAAQAKLMEQKMKDLEKEMKKKVKKAEETLEIKQVELALKEEDLKLRINAMSAKEDLHVRLQTMANELKAANDENKILQNGMKQMEVNKTKELAMELEKEGLEWILTERDKMCEDLKTKLTEVEQQLHKKESADKESVKCDEVSKHVTVTVENELQCSVCSELFIKAVTLTCAHSFCEFCINEWKKTKKECPMCRKPISSLVPSLALDNFISQYILSLPKDVQDKRRESEDERKAATAAKAVNAPSSSGRSSGSRGINGGRYEIVTHINLRSHNNAPNQGTLVTVNSRSVAPGVSVTQQLHQYPTTSANLPVNTTIDITTDEDDDDYWSSDSYRSDAESVSSDSDVGHGVAVEYNGEYDTCFRCGRRGHWARHCPFL